MNLEKNAEKLSEVQKTNKKRYTCLKVSFSVYTWQKVLLSVLNNKAVSVYLMIQNKLILTIRLEDTIFFEENRV